MSHDLALNNQIIKLHENKVISADEEYALAMRYYNEKDIEAAQKLTLGHLKFVAHVARKYQGYGLPQSDLFQEGCIGLMKAIENFDPHKGIRLITFAAYWIRAEIHEYIIKNWKIVKVATTKAQRKLFFALSRQMEKMRQSDSGKINYDLIAERMEVKKSEVMEMERRLNGSQVNIDECHQLSFDFSGTSHQQSQDLPTLENNSAITDDPALLYEQSHDKSKHLKALKKAVNALDERSKDIIQKRWFGEKKKTLKELSQEYGVSLERVRQIEEQAIDKMRSQFKGLGLLPLLR